MCTSEVFALSSPVTIKHRTFRVCTDHYFHPTHPAISPSPPNLLPSFLPVISKTTRSRESQVNHTLTPTPTPPAAGRARARVGGTCAAAGAGWRGSRARCRRRGPPCAAGPARRARAARPRCCRPSCLRRRGPSIWCRWRRRRRRRGIPCR